MNALFIVTYVLFGVMALLGIIYLITLFNYTKYTLFTKMKYSWAALTIYGLMFAILLISGILFFTTLKNKLDPPNDPILLGGLSFGFLGLDVLGIIAYLLIVTLHNKKKVAYEKIPTVDFKPALNEIKAKLGNIDEVKAKLQKHHKKYYEQMLLAYQDVLKNAKIKNFSTAEKYADIVMFNDTFVHKWCTLMNNYHLLLVYEFLIIF